MAPRRRRVRRRRRNTSLFQQIKVQGYVSLNKANSVAQLMMDDTGKGRDYRPFRAVITTVGSAGACYMVSLRGPEIVTKTFGPFMAGMSVSRHFFTWPPSSNWFPAGGNQVLLKVKLLPSQGVAPDQVLTVAMTTYVHLSDYNSGLSDCPVPVNNVRLEEPIARASSSWSLP